MTRKLAIIAAVVLVVGAVAARIALSLGSAAGSGSATKLPPATAKITRTTLVETTTVPGTLGYGDAVPVAAAGEGTLTWIADTGSTVRRGQPLFKLDERPVVALYGKLPPYRTLHDGLTGADVRQLEQNLAKLGYTGFTVDTMFAAGTAAAVRDWQTDLGLPQTGTVEPGQVVVIPGPVRIAEHLARVGDTGRAESGKPVLAYTGTTRLVTVELKVTDQALAAKGRKVTVILPGGTTAAGTIADVGAVATAPDQANGAAGQAGSQGQPGDSAQQAGSAASDARIAVTVDIRDQRALGTLQAAPVDVEFVSQKRAGVLAVPVAALLALPEGGYGVEIVEGSTTRIVPVKTGLFAGGRVEISGGRIAAGMNVGMPT